MNLHRSFLRALLFVKSVHYVNTAQIDPDDLYVDNYRLCVHERKLLAICMMSGTVTESFLIAACESGPRHAPYSIHKISITPLEQDMQHDVSVWGLLFQFHIAAGMMTPMGFGFATWGEGKGESWRSG